jgi:precorrin-6B methylase 2
MDDPLVVASRQSRVTSRESQVASRESDRRFDGWLADLEARHLADLAFPEVSRALRALSSAYVERRDRLTRGAALNGAGKRAAFALFYGPLHFLLVREVVARLPQACERQRTIVDLGCGTGAAGAAWASACRRAPRVMGIDRHPWALQEAARTYHAFGLQARTERALVGERRLPKEPASFVAAFTANELDEASRAALLAQLVERIGRGDRVLIVEPIARRTAPWWSAWQREIEAAGGRADEWRIPVERPPIVAKLDRAAGLDHRELTGRSLYAG